MSFFEKNENEEESQKTKSILKTNTPSNLLNHAFYLTKPGDSNSSRTSIGLSSASSCVDLRNDENNLLVSTDTSKKNKAEGYEILVKIYSSHFLILLI